jgi:hypothetical protein
MPFGEKNWKKGGKDDIKGNCGRTKNKMVNVRQKGCMGGGGGG